MKESKWFDAEYYTAGTKTHGYRPEDPYVWERRHPHANANVRDMIAFCRPFATVLDIGCGLGFTVRAFRDQQIAAYGVDFSEWAINNAEQSIKAFVRCMDATNLMFEDRTFDVVCSFDMLEHLDEKHARKALSEMLRVATKDVFIEVGTITREQEAVDSDPTHYAEITGDQSHCFYVTEDKWEQIISESGGLCIATIRARDLNAKCLTTTFVLRRKEDAVYDRGPGWLSKHKV